MVDHKRGKRLNGCECYLGLKKEGALDDLVEKYHGGSGAVGRGCLRQRT